MERSQWEKNEILDKTVNHTCNASRGLLSKHVDVSALVVGGPIHLQVRMMNQMDVLCWNERDADHLVILWSYLANVHYKIDHPTTCQQSNGYELY